MKLGLAPATIQIFLLIFFSLLTVKQILDATDGSQEVGSLVWQINHLIILTLSHFLHHGNVFLCQQIVGRIGTLSYGFGNLLDGDGLSLSLADAGGSLTFGSQDSLLLGSLSLVDNRRLFTFGEQTLLLLLTF